MDDLSMLKHYMPGFDVMLIRERELWFGKYSNVPKSDSAAYEFCVRCDDNRFDYLGKEQVLCYYNNHKWFMYISASSLLLNWTDDEVYMRSLATIARHEIGVMESRTLAFGTKPPSDLYITRRIKERFHEWFEGYHHEHIHFDEFPLKPTPPQPKFVQFNDDITTVVWQDGSHTIVKRTRGDAYDEEKAVAMAVIKKMCGNNGCEMDRYFKHFFEHSADISNSKKKKGAKKK